MTDEDSQKITRIKEVFEKLSEESTACGNSGHENRDPGEICKKCERRELIALRQIREIVTGEVK